MLLAYLGCLDTTQRADVRRAEVNADMNGAAIMAVGTTGHYVVGKGEEGGEMRIHAGSIR